MAAHGRQRAKKLVLCPKPKRNRYKSGLHHFQMLVCQSLTVCWLFLHFVPHIGCGERNCMRILSSPFYPKSICFEVIWFHILLLSFNGSSAKSSDNLFHFSVRSLVIIYFCFFCLTFLFVRCGGGPKLRRLCDGINKCVASINWKAKLTNRMSLIKHLLSVVHRWIFSEYAAWTNATRHIQELSVLEMPVITNSGKKNRM